MPTLSMSNLHRGPALRGRPRECEWLDRLLEDVRAGQSRVLVLRGEAGGGKNALLGYLVANPAADRFLVGLAVLSLLSEVAEEQPLVCVVDDAQWLDRASAQVLGFVARRLLAESVAMIFAVRDPSEDQELGSLPVMVVGGLSDADARALLDSATPGRLDERVRDRIVAESNGNPLALLELPKGLTAAELAGGFGRPDARPVVNRIEQSFLRRVQALPVETQRLLLAAAAEPVGDVTLLWRGAAGVGVGAHAAAPAAADGR